MDVNLSADEVISQIKALQGKGESLSKKRIKQLNPELMRSALFYFPSWEHAIQNSEML